MAITSARVAPVRTSARRDERALAAWAALVAAGIVIGGRLTAADPGLHTSASPFHGHWELAGGRGIVMAAGLAGVVVWWGPSVADRVRWRGLVVAATLAAFAWSAALSVSVGGHGFVSPLTTEYEYLAGVASIDAPGTFLRDFTEVLPSLPTHVKGHPPGLVLVLWLLQRLGLGAPVWAAFLMVSVGASAVAAVLLTVRRLADEQAARAAAPYLVLAPAAVWMATSGDAFFTGVGAWAVAATVLATTCAARRWSVLAGALWAVALLSSYGLVLLAPVAVGVAVSRRRPDVLAVTGATAVTMLVVVGTLTGFWWHEGLQATRELYLAGFAATRSATVFVWLNLAAVAIALGPVVVPAVRRARGPVAMLALGAVAGIVVADLSQLSKAEVERIWLPWIPWILVATAALPLAQRRRWLTLQAGTAVVVQLALRSPW